MPNSESKSRAVDSLAKQIKENSRGKLSSEQAHKIAVDTAQKRDRKEADK